MCFLYWKLLSVRFMISEYLKRLIIHLIIVEDNFLDLISF